MPKHQWNSTTITIQIPARFWTQDSAEASEFVDMFAAAICEGDEDISQDIQARMDTVKGIAFDLDVFQKKAERILREEDVPDFREMHEVSQQSPLYRYAFELTRWSNYNLADTERRAKVPIRSVQQIRNFLASNGMVDRNEQNVFLSIIHQNLLGIYGQVGTLFLSVVSMCLPEYPKTRAKWNMSLLSYDPATHIAELKCECKVGREYMSIALCSIDLAKKTIAIDTKIMLPKDDLAPCAEKFLRKFEGDNPEHFVFGVASSAPSWRDWASIIDLETKEEELSGLIFLGECSRKLQISAFDLMQEIRSLRQVIYNVFYNKGEEKFIKHELSANARSYLNVLHKIADMEIKCLKEKIPPKRHEFYQLRDQLQELSFQPNSLGRKIQNAFHGIVSALSSFLHIFVFFKAVNKVAKKPKIETETMRTKAFGSLRKCLRTSIFSLVECAKKNGLCLDAKIFSSKSAALIPEAMELQPLRKSGQKAQQVMEPETQTFGA